MTPNLTAQDLVVGERYSWKHQPEKVWCEVRAEDLQMMEKTA